MSDIVKIAQRIIKTLDWQMTMADAIREREPEARVIPSGDYQNITRAAIIARIWKHEGRKVLAMHPEIVRECSLATSDKIPTRNLRALPYLSPMVVFPDPPEFESWAAGNRNQRFASAYERPEAMMRLLGFLTFSNGAMSATNEELWGPDQDVPMTISRQYQSGKLARIKKYPKESMYRTYEQVTGNTHDKQAISFGMLAVLEICDEFGNYLDSEVNTLSIPFQGVDLTLGEIVDDLLERFEWYKASVPVSRIEAERDPSGPYRVAQDWMGTLMETIVGSLFYLCSTSLEAERVPKKVAARIQPGYRKPPEVYKVGWKMGEALTKYRRAQAALPPDISQPGREQRPTQRRAHVRRWPNDTEGVKPLIWIHPYWTHREKLGPESAVDGTPNMAHKVPKVGPRGDAEASMRAVMEMEGPDD